MEDNQITLDNVYNMDETEIQMGTLGQSTIVILRRDASNYMRQPGNTNWVSNVETVNALGRTIAPFLIFKGTSHQLQ